MEHFIKECKSEFRIDQVSQKTFEANESRLQQMRLAHNLINGFKAINIT